MTGRRPPPTGDTPSDKRPETSDVPNRAVEDDGVYGAKTEVRAPSKAPPASKRDRPFLIILEGGNVGEMYALREPRIVVGRASNATVRIEDDGISRRHARLIIAEGEVRIEDLQSTNGTLVNGEPVTSTRLLRDGDKVTLGSTVILKFTYSDDLEVAFQRKMLEAALLDGLTGAFNKRYLMDRLQTEFAFAQRHKMPLSLIMLDLDHFKKINDTFGHPAGDEVLIKAANVVQRTIRKEDIFARYGGEEFVVLCRGVDVSNAGVLAERLRERIAAMLVEHAGHRIAVTVSLGVAGFPEPGAETPPKLVAAADEALYEAKRCGRNRVVIKQRS
jgi:diguanylate cyclase (GGDEF)-like protein